MIRVESGFPTQPIVQWLPFAHSVRALVIGIFNPVAITGSKILLLISGSSSGIDYVQQQRLLQRNRYDEMLLLLSYIFSPGLAVLGQ